MDDDAGPFSSEEQGETWEAQRERRTHALHELAQQRMGNGQQAPELHAPDERLRRPSARSLPRLTLPARRFPARRRLDIALVSVVLLVAIVATVLWRNTRPSVTTLPQASLPIVTLTPSADGVTCPVGVAWSPDATRVAVLGYTPVAVHTPYCFSQAHARPGATSGIVNIYDVQRGRLLLSFQPDSIILNGHGVVLPNTPPSPQDPFPPFLRYDTVLWSEDGRSLALPFFVQPGFYTQLPPYVPSPGNIISPASTMAGVLLTDLTNGNQRVLASPYHDTGARLEWDLTGGTLVSAAVTLPPALTYQWGANGVLLPLTPLTAQAPPTISPAGPIGNPVGGNSFSVWQPGVAAYGSYALPSQGPPGAPLTYAAAPHLYLWYSQFGAWSPDGRYLITSAFAGGRVAVPDQPAPTAVTLAKAHAATLPVLPTRDATLGSLFSPTSPGAGDLATLQFVAWSPDGHLAAVLTNDEFSQQAGAAVTHPAVTVSVSATAQALASLKPQTNFPSATDNILGHQNIWLQWSPDGKHLLLLDNLIGTLTIWNPASLPLT